jgi:hypothetical protein
MGHDTRATASLCCHTTNTEKRANPGRPNSPRRSAGKYGKGNHDYGRRRRDDPLLLGTFLIRLAEFAYQMGPHYRGRFLRDQAWGRGNS